MVAREEAKDMHSGGVCEGELEDLRGLVEGAELYRCEGGAQGLRLPPGFAAAAAATLVDAAVARVCTQRVACCVPLQVSCGISRELRGWTRELVKALPCTLL